MSIKIKVMDKIGMEKLIRKDNIVDKKIIINQDNLKKQIHLVN